jgi:segregation and condensation protein B
MPTDEPKLPMPKSLQQVIGGLLFGADHPLTMEEIRTCLKSVAETEPENETMKLFASASPREVQDTLDEMAKELGRMEYGFELTNINGAYRFQSQACCGRWLRNLLKQDRPNRLSPSALETLAIIAYRQPIAKSEMESIRGVTVDHIIKALMELHLVRIVGRSDLPGRPFLYGTTSTFLDHFGLSTLKELNELDPTLQRSKPSERKALYTRKPKPEPEPAQETAGAPTPAANAPAAPAAQDTAAVQEILGNGSPKEGAAPDEPVFRDNPA